MKTTFAFLISLFMLTTPAHAELQKVHAQLVSEHTAIIPGETLHLGILQTIAPGWHTYWRNPGDSGLATEVKWTLPTGFSAGEIQWPTPDVQPYGELINYGYADQILLPVDITLPDNLPLGKSITIHARADWLACADICIPEGSSLSITLPVDKINDFTEYAPVFKETRARQPREFMGTQTAELKANQIKLKLKGDWQNFRSANFFPGQALVIQNNAPQTAKIVGDDLVINLTRDETTIDIPTNVSGDVRVTTDEGTQSYQFNSPITAAPAAMPAEVTSLAVAILFAFLGGIILNLMPCVFPILSMKALALMHKSGAQRRHIVTGGIVYTLGVLASFWLLAGSLMLVRAAGGDIGWGVQLQSPQFVGGLALLLFVIGLLLGGLADVGQSLANIGDELAHRRGHWGTFFTGALAVIVATPCTAPFMGGAIFYAFTQTWWVTLLVMTALGIGLALPYLILTFWPPALRYLPKPGLWMKQFKEFLAFPMFAAAVWLLWVLAQQTDAMGMLLILVSLWAYGFGLWIWQQSETTRSWKLFLRSIVLILFLAGLYAVSEIDPLQTTVRAENKAQAFSMQKLDSLRSENQPVFVNMTAAWCITCLANEKIALNTQAVQDYIKDNNIAYLKGDWTNRDPNITAYLQSFGRNGVPLYVYYPAGNGCPVVLPQLLTPDTVVQTLSQPPHTGDCS